MYKNGISKNRDFLFEFDYIQNFDFINKIFIYIVDFSIFIIQIYNIIIIFIHLFRKTKFEIFYKYK